MKVLLVALVIIFSAGMASAGEKFVPAVPCPKTTMVNSCMECHIKGNFKIKETRPDAHLIYPNVNMRILGWETGKLEGHFLLTTIDGDLVREFFDYLREKKITKAVIEVHSPGGGLFTAQRIISLMQEYRAEGGQIETRVNGFAASAGFLIFVAGDKGKRFVCPQADLMWHELISFKLFAIDTPASSEEGARVMRHLQDTANARLAEVSKLSKSEIDEKIKNREFWMTGIDAVRFGFADKLLK